MRSRNTAANAAASAGRDAARRDERVRGAEAQREQQRVKDQEAVGPEEEDERRGNQRIDERLGEIQPAPRRDPRS